MTFGGWERVVYVCVGCNATYTTLVYGGKARQELGAATCTKCGGSFMVRADQEEGGDAID